MLASVSPDTAAYSEAAAPVRVLSATTDFLIPELAMRVTAGDARPLILARYLNYHQSPLGKYATKIVEVSDKYKIDYRLIVAIARQESNLCKRIPAGSNNCWGYGIYGDRVVKFPDLARGIEKEAELLAKYKKGGLDTPEEIMTRYTPPSAAGDGAWASGVKDFLAELE